MKIKKSHQFVFNLYDKKIHAAYTRTLTEVQGWY